MIGLVEQTKDVKESTFAAAGRTHYRVDRSRSDIQRHSAQRVHARFIFAQIAFYFATTQKNFGGHILEPRKVTTGGRLAARRAGA